MTWIGRYRIDASIGEGAMAHVYLAHDPSINRLVAIKVLKAEFRNNAEIVRRFLSESRAAGMLSHANIVTIFDVGEADGTPYIAMERVSGCPLDEQLTETGRMTFERVVALGIQIADALAYAHARGVVHRDIKPSNILICDGGKTAKLLDFGIARIDGHDVSDAQLQVQRTQAGQVLGTPRYMSPEQALGLPVDARSDLFSLGVVLYEMLTGKVAFTGTSVGTLAIQIAQEQPVAIERHVPDCPRGLRFIIGKLLAKKAEQRFADADQLAYAFRRELESAACESESPHRGMSLGHKLPLILSAGALLALAAGVTVVSGREDRVMEQMALTSGSSIAAFVARNAALHVADNAGLPLAQQDWAPLQAFAETAATDPNVQNLVIADEQDIIRASSNPKLVGRRYRATPGDTMMRKIGGSMVGETAGGFRFIQPVRYAGTEFGHVDVVLKRASLDAAQRSAKILLAGLGSFIILVVGIFAAASARFLVLPLRRLRRAMDDVTSGNLSFRISHGRKDEIGRLFDAMNRMVASIADRQEHVATVLVDAEQAMLRTRIEPGPPAAAPAEKRVA